jgi:hypothetical protein
MAKRTASSFSVTDSHGIRRTYTEYSDVTIDDIMLMLMKQEAAVIALGSTPTESPVTRSIRNRLIKTGVALR